MFKQQIKAWVAHMVSVGLTTVLTTTTFDNLPGGGQQLWSVRARSATVCPNVHALLQAQGHGSTAEHAQTGAGAAGAKRKTTAGAAAGATMTADVARPE